MIVPAVRRAVGRGRPEVNGLTRVPTDGNRIGPAQSMPIGLLTW